MADIAISCLVDDDPTLLMQGWNWLCSLHRLGTASRAAIYVHYVDEIDPARLRTYADLGAHLVPVSRFGNGEAAYCNKIRQMENPALAEHDYVILSDADVAFSTCPTSLATGSAVRGKPVDKENPPETTWRALLADAGLGNHATTVPLPLAKGRKTFSTNLNGGLYVIPAQAWAVLAGTWAKWAKFALDRRDTLRRFTVHSDQLGFALALLAAELSVDHLGIEANFPLHLRRDHATIEPVELLGIHYHRELDNHGLLKPGRVGWLAEQVRKVNADLVETRRERFDNAIFWDFRYHTAPTLGSGVGSRGDVLRQKRAMLLPYFRAFADKKVLDVGCGDLETTRLMPSCSYHGIDVSAAALATASEKRPDWHFDSSNLADLPDSSYDLALCLDVLLHQSDPAGVESIVADLVRVSRHAVIASGFAQAPEQGGIVFFSEQLDDLLARQPGVSEVLRIGGYRDVDVFLAIKSDAASSNVNDITLPDLAHGMSQTPDWQLLSELVDLSRRHLGFFPRTIIRTIEYPWFVRRLERQAGERVLDIGAGVSALPIWLSQRGCEVTTVDNHPRERLLATRDDWNEWGYLDYSQIDPTIESHRVDAAQFQGSAPFGAIYSVSVVEHLPADTRRRLFANIQPQLARNGQLYLSLDLVPGTRDLWLLSEGKQVEDRSIHGTLDDILAELTASGFKVAAVTTRTDIRGSRTDLAMLEARRAVDD